MRFFTGISVVAVGAAAGLYIFRRQASASQDESKRDYKKFELKARPAWVHECMIEAHVKKRSPHFLDMNCDQLGNELRSYCAWGFSNEELAARSFEELQSYHVTDSDKEREEYYTDEAELLHQFFTTKYVKIKYGLSQEEDEVSSVATYQK